MPKDESDTTNVQYWESSDRSGSSLALSLLLSHSSSLQLDELKLELEELELEDLEGPLLLYMDGGVKP